MSKNKISSLKIDRNSKLPRYCQLSEQLKAMILKKDFAEGELMPSDNELMSRFSLSRSTVRQAVDMLAREGLVARVHGKGTYVNSAIAVRENKKQSVIAFFLDECLKNYHKGDWFNSDLLLYLNFNLAMDNCFIKPFFIPKGKPVSFRGFDPSIYSGFLFFGQFINNNRDILKKFAENSEKPAVFVDYDIKSHKSVSIVGQNFEGARQAVKYLLKKGAGKIAFVGGYSHPNYLLRFKGYWKALNEHGIKPDKSVIWLDFKKALVEIPGKLNSVDGIFFCADWAAHDMIAELKKKNIWRPEKLKLASYDNIMALKQLTPEVVSVSVDRSEMALKALKALKGGIKKPLIEIKSTLENKKD